MFFYHYPQKKTVHWPVVILVSETCEPRNARERGLHERVSKQDIGLDCRVQWFKIPMLNKKEQVKMIEWPFFLPHMLASLRSSVHALQELLYLPYFGIIGCKKSIIESVPVNTPLKHPYPYAAVSPRLPGDVAPGCRLLRDAG